VSEFDGIAAGRDGAGAAMGSWPAWASIAHQILQYASSSICKNEAMGALG
jgi:hypothetical protein